MQSESADAGFCFPGNIELFWLEFLVLNHIQSQENDNLNVFQQMVLLIEKKAGCFISFDLLEISINENNFSLLFFITDSLGFSIFSKLKTVT